MLGKNFRLLLNQIEIHRNPIKENNAKIASLDLRLEDFEKKFSKENIYKDMKINDRENIIKIENEKVIKDNFKCFFYCYLY